MDVMQIANGIPMWIACGIPVVLVVIQAVLFARGAYGAGKKMGLGEDKMKKAMKIDLKYLLLTRNTHSSLMRLKFSLINTD